MMSIGVAVLRQPVEPAALIRRWRKRSESRLSGNRSQPFFLKEMQLDLVLKESAD